MNNTEQDNGERNKQNTGRAMTALGLADKSDYTC